MRTVEPMPDRASLTSIVILFCAITSSRVIRAGELAWPKESFAKPECDGGRQPIVEIWPTNGTQYIFVSQRVTWDEGRMLCLNYNARLAIVDNAEKALIIAKSIANSNIEMEDSWIGGRRIDSGWTWVDIGIRPGTKPEIPVEPNVENFPPWAREPTRPTKECLAVDRRSHDNPNFVDLDCRLQRPIICEKKSDETIRVPVPSKWIQISRNTYTLYHGKLTWHEAATFCRAKGARLAILKTTSVVNILTNGMTKTRPDFETVWIGAYFSYGQWIWMATGSILNPLTDDNGYPPWRSGRPEKNDGCLLLDRHLDDTTNFIEINCDKKRDFVCEEYPEDEDEDWLNEPAKFSHGNSTYIIYPLDKSWSESHSFCNERGSVLAHVGSTDTLKLIIEAMGDHPRAIHHVWLGGEFRKKADEWYWIENDEKISKHKGADGFPPWASIDAGLDHDPANSSCLNLDRTDHVKPHFYGLDCASKQSFVCQITCDVPPSVKNGTWKCYGIEGGRECSLTCDKGLVVMGVRNVTCTVFSGWITGHHWLEFPLCMDTREYTSRMIRSVSHDMQKSAGYYIIIDHTNPEMRGVALRFAERLIKAFPASHNLQVGMSCLSTNPPIHIPFNHTDNCEILTVITSAMGTVSEARTESGNDRDFYNDVSKFNGRRILIIAIIDSKRAPTYADAIDHFKSSGHHVTVVGLEEDWKALLPLSTVGYDRRSNLFLFDNSEIEKIIRELVRLDKKPSKCKKSIDYSIDATRVSPTPEASDIKKGNVQKEEKASTVDTEEFINEQLTARPAIPALDTNEENKTIQTLNTKYKTDASDEEQSKHSVDQDKNDEQSPSNRMTSGTKNYEGLPRIYAEQEAMSDLEETQTSEQPAGVKESDEIKDNAEDGGQVEASTSGPT